MTVPGTGEFTYHADATGSVRSLTDDTGSQQWRYNYEPFGAARDTDKASDTAPANPMRWAGEYSEGAGGVHLRARQYDTETGRFGTPDPAGAVTPGATYTYADNNPLTKNDPLGLWPDWSLDDIKNVSTKVSTYAGGAALVLGATGIGAPVAGVLGAVAVGAGAITAAASAYQAWDTCTNGAKGSCGDAIVTAAIDTALALPGAGMGAAGRSLARGAAKSEESALSRLLRNGVRDDRGSNGPFRKGTTEAGNRGARYSGKWYDSEDAARRAAEGYASKHPNSCTFRGLCGAGDHYHVDKEINGFHVHTRHYYFPR
jgi:RHS repeat-associated protein